MQPETKGSGFARRELERAISLSPGDRMGIAGRFFERHPGLVGRGPGLGRAILDFQAWEIASGRISPEGGSDWWRAVNGFMVLDIGAAADGNAIETAAVKAWRAYREASGEGVQQLLWEAHQRSLHAGLRASRELLEREGTAEREFAGIVIDVVDRTALANATTDSDDLRNLTDRYYPAAYPTLDGQLAPLQRLRVRSAERLCTADGSPFENVGMSSTRWD